MSNITCGYLNGSSAAPNAIAVQGDPTTKVNTVSVLLNQRYWMIGIPHVRNAFAHGQIPFFCPAGSSLQLPYFEAAALVAAGAAAWM